MEIDKLNSLVELYFKKCDEVNPKRPFLKWLKPDKPTYTWGDIKERIFKLSYKIKSLIKEGDRCLILSENFMCLRFLRNVHPLVLHNC